MNTVQRIAKNTAVLLAATIISKVLSFFYVMYTARYLGAEGFGVLSFALAFTRIFGVLTDLGLGPLTVREVARDKSLAKKYLSNISVMKAILVTITFTLIAIVINLLGYPEQTIKIVYLISLSVVFNSFTGMFYSIFRAFEKMEYQSLGQILSSALMLFGVFSVISRGFSVVGFASLYFLISVVALVYSFVILIWKFAKQKLEVDWSFWKPTIKEALPFGLTGAFITIYLWIDSVMLSLMKGDEVVGWYNAAYRIILILLFIPIAFNSAVFPLMSRFYISSKDSLKFTFEKHFKYMLIIGFPIGIGITLFSDRIVLLIFGAEYMPSVIALKILTWAIVFIFTRTAFERVLESANRQIIVTKVFGGCALLNIILNFILIPKYSYVGAAVATLITDFAVFVIIFVWSLKIGYSIPNKQLIEVTSKVISASLLMGVFIKYFGDQNLLILAFTATIIYFGLILLIKGFDKYDVRLFKKLFAKKEVGSSDL